MPAVDCGHESLGRRRHEQTAHHLTRINRGGVQCLLDAENATLRGRRGAAAPRVVCAPPVDLALAAPEWQPDGVMCR